MTWAGYPLILLIFQKFFARGYAISERIEFLITIIIAAKNEERNIEKRIHNILNQNYNPGNIEIIIGSDGSTDDTVVISKKFADSHIKVLEFKEGRGRASVHNDASLQACGELVLFTDAETIFEKDFLHKIVQPFRDKRVGAAVGRIIYGNANDSSITQAASNYWDYEAQLRLAESTLGILAFGTGACTAFRKNLYQALSPTEDIDYAQTLNVVRQGFKVVFVPDAIAYDIIAGRIERTFRNRVRQTSRAFKSIINRLFSRKVMRRPHLFCGILFHKTFRHLTPFFLIIILLSNWVLINQSLFYAWMCYGQLVFYVISGLGLLLYQKVKMPKLIVLSSNFLLLNIGRFIGVLKAFRGQASAKY